MIASGGLARRRSPVSVPVHLEEHVPHRSASEPDDENQYGNDSDDDEQRVSFLIHS
jgi:hypothetical protein